MAITAAQVEANGWVLRVTFTGTTGSFASYALDPDGTPKVTLNCTHPGFAPSGGSAVAASHARTLVATKPLRKPVNPASPTSFIVDEIDNGNGTVTVRLALSDYVHATETSLALSVAAGWRTGEPAATPTVANTSAFVAAMPIFRWAMVPYERVTGSFDLELIAFSHHPSGLAPLAGVRFTATDGTNTKSVWATALSTSTRHGDNLRCYRVTIDPVTATALTAGLLRCDAEAYPWLGSMRSTDAAGTRSMTGLANSGYLEAAQTPMIMGYDPLGTRYPAAFLHVDPAGTGTASAAMVKPSHAAAKAVAQASRPATVAVALQALYLANRSFTAANGGVAGTRAGDAAVISLAGGTHAGFGTTSPSVGFGTGELPVIIRGDPDLPDPRASCIVQTATVVGTRTHKHWLVDLTIECGGTALAGTAQSNFHLDRVLVRGKAGSEGSAVAVFSATAAGSFRLSATNVRWWRSGTKMSGITHRFGLIRNCEFSRTANALALLGGRFIPSSEDGLTGSDNAVGAWTGGGTLGSLEDVIIAGVDLRSTRASIWVTDAAPAAAAATPNASKRRYVFAGNLCERIGGDPQPFSSMGENATETLSYNIIEGNSFVGERFNLLYSDPDVATVADTNTKLNQAFGNRIANNSFDWAPTKHDAFLDSSTATLRGTADGYRPHMVEAWSIIYGVGWEGNYDFGRTGGGNFGFEYLGRRSVQAIGGVPLWSDDRSVLGSGAGGGNYQPGAASPLGGRGLRGNLDRDRGGALRIVPFSSGAIEALASAVTALAPVAGRSSSRSGSPLTRWFGVAVPAKARSRSRASVATSSWFAALASARGSSAMSGIGVTLLPGSLALLAASTRHRLRDAGVAALPDLIFATPRFVRIEGEVRVQLINRD